MSYQYRSAAEGKEFKPTYSGRHLKEKFAKESKYRKRCPKTWITKGYVTEQEIKHEQTDS